MLLYAYMCLCIDVNLCARDRLVYSPPRFSVRACQVYVSIESIHIIQPLGCPSSPSPAWSWSWSFSSGFFGFWILLIVEWRFFLFSVDYYRYFFACHFVSPFLVDFGSNLATWDQKLIKESIICLIHFLIHF